MGKQETDTNKPKKHAIKFLKTELSEFNEEYLRLHRRKINQSSFLIIIIALVFACLVLIAQSSKNPINIVMTVINILFVFVTVVFFYFGYNKWSEVLLHKVANFFNVEIRRNISPFWKVVSPIIWYKKLAIDSIIHFIQFVFMMTLFFRE